PVVPAVAVPALPVAPAHCASTPDDKHDGRIDFPLIKDCLESIADLHPQLPTHIGTLLTGGFTHVNDLVMPELSYRVLMDVTKINFVDATLLLRKAKDVVHLL